MYFNFGGTDIFTVDIQAAETGDWYMKASVITDGAGNAQTGYMYAITIPFDAATASRTVQSTNTTPANFPTTAGTFTLSVDVSNGSDGIEIFGVIIETGGKA